MDQRIEPVRALALVGIARHQQDGDGGMSARGGVRERDAIHHGHADVAEQQLERASFSPEHVQRMRAIGGCHDLVAVLSQGARDQAADRFLIVCDKNACHGFSFSSAVRHHRPVCGHPARP